MRVCTYPGCTLVAVRRTTYCEMHLLAYQVADRMIRMFARALGLEGLLPSEEAQAPSPRPAPPPPPRVPPIRPPPPAPKMPSPYRVLGVSCSSTSEEIKRAYKRRVFRLHPDRNRRDPRANEKLRLVTAAYEILSDPRRRAIYDASHPPGRR